MVERHQGVTRPLFPTNNANCLIHILLQRTTIKIPQLKYKTIDKKVLAVYFVLNQQSCKLWFNSESAKV